MADAPNPKLWGVIYTKPNSDGSRKSCGNCVMFANKSNECYLFEPNREITEDMICGYHVNGEPMPEFKSRLPMEPLDPDYAGLEHVKNGTSCDNCKFYTANDTDAEQGKGGCMAVDAEGSDKPAVVEAKGCCSRWEAAEQKKEASVEPSIGAISRGVFVELRNGTQDRVLATKIAMENLSRDPGYYK